MGNEVLLLTAPQNFAVVQLPERNFPGVVVQGDTLHSLVATLNRMTTLLQAREYEELAGEIDGVKEQLSDALARYQETCRRNEIKLPYPT